MNNVSATSAPTQQTMSVSDRTHAENMAVYAKEKLEFESSTSRRCAAQLGYFSATAGTLGCLVASPVVNAKVAGSLASGVSLAASTACCIAACISLGFAKVPCEPTHPDLATWRQE